MSLSLQILTLPDGETLSRREVPVPGTPFLIGRDYACDLCLPDRTATLSRRHLRIDRSAAGGFTVTDLSTNGSSLNGAPLAPSAAQPVGDGDLLTCAGYRLLLTLAGAPARPLPPPDAAGAPAPGARERITVSPLPLTEQGETVATVPDAPFGPEIADLEARLLFDPFEDGPGLQTAPRAGGDGPDLRGPSAAPSPSAVVAATIEDDRDLPLAPPLRPTDQTGLTGAQREELAAAIDRAVGRFLDQFDPARLEREYREYLGPFSRRRARYWTIFHRQFARRREGGDYARIFRALLAEEVRRR